MSKITVTVYSRPGCVQCTMTYRELDKNGVTYDVVDLAADASAYGAIEHLKYQQAPVVFVDDDTHWSRFRPDKIAGLRAR